MARVHPLVAIAINALLGPAAPTDAVGDLSIPEVGEHPAVLRLRRKDGSVTTTLGRRESGKSVLAYRVAQVLERPTYAVSPEQPPPPWVTRVGLEDLDEEPPPRSTLILDDLPVYLSSRDYHDPLVRRVERMIPVVRHERKLHLIFCSQLASLADKFSLDVDLAMLKPPSILFRDIERRAVQKLQESIAHVWEGKSDAWVRRHVWIKGHQEEGLARVKKDW